MALGTPTALGTAASAALGSASAVSGSFSFTAGEYIYAFVNWQQGTSVPNAGTISDSQGHTWSQLYENTFDPGTGVRHRIRLFRAVSNGNSMTVTVTPATSGGTEVVLCSIVGVAGAAAYSGNTGFATTSSGAAAPSLTNAPRADSTVIGWYFTNGGTAISPPTNYTEIQEFASGTGSRIVECAYDAGSAAQSASWDFNNFEGALLLELTAPLEPSLFTNSQTFHQPTVTPGAVDLTPSPLTNTQTFYDPTVASNYTLSPSLFTNAQIFYEPVVVPGSVALTPSLFTNSQTFYAPTVTDAGFVLYPSLFTNSQIFYAATLVRDTWVPLAAAAGSWSADPAASGTWTPEAAASGSWAAKSAATGPWTPLPTATGTWRSIPWTSQTRP